MRYLASADDDGSGTLDASELLNFYNEVASTIPWMEEVSSFSACEKESPTQAGPGTTQKSNR